jgi:hypothetical protein
MLTEQQVFDQTCRHLIQQGGPSRGLHYGKVICLYRDREDRKCAAGFWIPDESYHTGLEGSPIETPMVWDILPNHLKARGSNMTLLTELQQAHDTCHFKTDIDGVHRWINIDRYGGIRKELMQLAMKRRLDAHILAEFRT